ncbi:hypothetical protein [Nocardia beijingensis]|uniref:hypothetical protein n=1 Tax=Nocardia beijingensis TaxID=95162 RepID=UPI0012F4BAAA|nr:hypothetical protein [Nocardia beijingensis]
MSDKLGDPATGNGRVSSSGRRPRHTPMTRHVTGMGRAHSNTLYPNDFRRNDK